MTGPEDEEPIPDTERAPCRCGSSECEHGDDMGAERPADVLETDIPW